MEKWTTRVFRERAILAELSPWWDAQPSAMEIPYLNTSLLRCWIKGFIDPDTEPLIRVLFKDGEPVAAMPMYEKKGALRSLSDHVDPFDLVVSAEPEVTEYIPRWLQGTDVSHFYKVSAGSIIVSEARNQRRTLIERVRQSPYIDLSRGIEAARAATSHNHRRSIRRRWRRLKDVGEVTYVDHPDQREIAIVLDQALALEASGWKGIEGRAILMRPGHERWYRSLTEVAQEHGWLRLSALYLNGEMIAFAYDLVYAARRFSMLTSYDESPDLYRLSVGNLLLDAILERSASDGLTSYELGHGSRESKRHWTDRARLVYDVTSYGSTPRGRVKFFARSLRQRTPGQSSDGEAVGDGIEFLSEAEDEV